MLIIIVCNCAFRGSDILFLNPKVYYKDPIYAMGHIMIRMKKHVVGDESQHVVLFRCIQTMNLKVPYNTCYTGGRYHFLI